MALTRRQHFYRGIILLLIGLSLLYLLFWNKKVTEYSKNFFYMDTFINIKIYASDKHKVDNAFKEIDKIYDKYHKLTNRYDAYAGIKNVYYLNHELGKNEKVTIDKELYDIIKYSIDAYDQSNGLFNVALGNAIDVWKKYRDQGDGVPTYSELSNIGSLSINDIILHDDYYIELANGVSIDLGAISKGYVTELVGNYLESIGLNKYIINAGGNVKVGNHYNKDKYKIGIEEPIKDSNKIYEIINANNVSVVTSGSYERYYEYNGKIYHHIIDPKKLYPPTYYYAVTIITKDSRLADMLSTALFLMPLEAGKKYIDSLPMVEAIWYDIDGNIHYSKGFDQYE